MKRMRLFGWGLLAVTFGAPGCGQSNPPAVAVAPVEVAESKAEPVAPAQPPADAKPDPVPDGGTFAFPDDTGGKELAETVRPAAPAGMSAGVPVTKRERKVPAFLDSPAPPTFDAANSPPQLPLSKMKPVLPHPLPDRVPPDLGGAFPQLSKRGEIAAGPRTRMSARDVTEPVDLPLLSARAVADRAPLTDPTIEFTAQSVISANLPLRTGPTGFIRINLPDPFENAVAAKPRTPVVEDPNRSLGNPPPPK